MKNFNKKLNDAADALAPYLAGPVILWIVFILVL